MRRSFERASHVSIERRGKKKKISNNYQRFDPNSVFQHVEETPGNFIGIVSKDGDQPRVKVVSQALGNTLKEFNVHFRKNSETELKLDNVSYFSPGAFNRPRKNVSPAEKMKVGDIVELKSCHISDNQQTLCPWDVDVISSSSSASAHIMMPEMPSCLISKARTDDASKRDYQIVSAARGEAKKITAFLDNLPLLKQHLGYQIPMVNGFIMRGPIKPGHKVWHGFTCVKTLHDIEEGLSNDQIIFNFIKNKGHGVVDQISKDSPWEIVPLYVGRPTAAVREKLDHSFQNKHFMSFGMMGATDLKFVHCNLLFAPTSTGPYTVKHFNLARAKPLQMDAAVPAKAIEKKIKEMMAEPAMA